MQTRVESAYGVCNQRLNPRGDAPLSNVAFNFNMRRYTVAAVLMIAYTRMGGILAAAGGAVARGGRGCRQGLILVHFSAQTKRF